MEQINVWTGPAGFGDTCMAGMFVSILRDQHFNAYLCQNKYSHLLDVPITQNGSNFSFHYIADFWRYKRSNHKSMMEQNLERVPFNQGIKITKNYVPVKFYDEKIDPVEIVLNTRCSDWPDNIKGWDRFNDLKKILDDNKITWIDLDDKRIYDNLSLNYVKHSKAYVGLDTGRSHYSSFFANGKGIIIQSGHSKPRYWGNYDYAYICNEGCCRMSPCFLRPMSSCHHKHRLCCKDISADRVFDEIRKRLSF